MRDEAVYSISIENSKGRAIKPQFIEESQYERGYSRAITWFKISALLGYQIPAISSLHNIIPCENRRSLLYDQLYLSRIVSMSA